jgi:hypothetical protein
MNIRPSLLIATLALGITSALAQSTPDKPETPPPPHEKQAPAVEKHLKVFERSTSTCTATRSGTG